MIERRSVPENKHYVAVKAADLDRLEAEIERLRAELAECRKDAERYRWLRSNSTRPAEPWSTHESPESLDSVIDAALGVEKKDDNA